uniref:Immunoglobulin domain-containing protein n=1 Tax=Gadus morhua TaxID=8049 RepID=A0A8C5C6K7_GADMO
MQIFMLLQTIHSIQDRVQALQGDNVTLSCNYTSSNYLFWYRQFPSSPPQFLIKEYQKISSAVLTDSALYYCALKSMITSLVLVVLRTRL